MKKNLYIIAGCNGAGKTTASFTILPKILDCKEFHNIETDVIKRRYLNGIKNLFEIYLPIADEVMIFDNSEGKHDLNAKKTLETEIDIFSEIKFNKLKNYYHGNT